MTAVALSRPARVLRIEIRRSAAVWTIPLLAGLFFFDAFRTASGLPPVWTVRSWVVTTNMIADFGPVAAGLAAWVASREGRRNTGDLLATTVRPAWARQATALSATLFWLLLTFLAGVAAVYIDTAQQATWGGPPLWPVAVGALEVATFAVIGFTAGALFPGRFTAPLATVGAFVLAVIGDHAGRNVTPTRYVQGLLSPSTTVPLSTYGVFYHVAPDVAIAQVMFIGGITVALLGVLALQPRSQIPRGEFVSAIGRTGRWLCAAGAALLIAGAAAAGTAYALIGTAKPSVSGWDIPALHDAASDQPVPYTPDCAGTTFKVCVHPAFGDYLDAAAAALRPVAAEIAGLPGAPVRAEQVPSGSGVRSAQGVRLAGMPATGIRGTPPVYNYSSDAIAAPFWGSPASADSASWAAGFQEDFLTAFVSGSDNLAYLNPSPGQQAVVAALTTALSVKAQLSLGFVNGQSRGMIAAAAQRFASLSPAARRAWLAFHLPALRAGAITLAQIP